MTTIKKETQTDISDEQLYSDDHRCKLNLPPYYQFTDYMQAVNLVPYAEFLDRDKIPYVVKKRINPTGLINTVECAIFRSFER